MKLYCRCGAKPYRTRRFNVDSDEWTCTECGGRRSTTDPAKPRKQLGGSSSSDESRSETEARQRFNEIVCSWPCFFKVHRKGHQCAGRKDAHHLVPKDWIRNQHLSDLPEDELLRVLYAPIIGAPLCRAAHVVAEARTDFIFWEELDPECIEFCQRHGMVGRLELESPRRRAAA